MRSPRGRRQGETSAPPRITGKEINKILIRKLKLFVRIFYYVYSSAISKNGLKRIKLNFASRFSSCFYWGNKILDPPLRPRAAEPSCTEEKVNLTECLVPDYEASRLVTSERCGKEKYLLSLPGIETRFLGCSVYTDA